MITIPISEVDATEVLVENWPYALDLENPREALVGLKLKHKSKYTSVLLDSSQLAEVIIELIQVGAETWGAEFANKLDKVLTALESH